MPVVSESKSSARTSEHARIHISLPNLIALCAALIVTTALATGFIRFSHAPAVAAPVASVPSAVDAPPAEIPVWGELSTTDVNLEQPEEYVAFDATMGTTTVWIFSESNAKALEGQLLDCGMTPAQAAKALSLSQADAAGLRILPDAELILSLPPEVRAKLYRMLAKNSANRLMQEPYRVLAGTFDSIFVDSGVDKSTVELVQKLLYPAGKNQFFSDLPYVLGKVSNEHEKLELVKALTRQPAVLARIRIRPDTDIDKLLGYWASGSGAREKDARPLLEALKRLHDGGSIGLGYLLPPFARQRMFTSPMPTQEGDVPEDCHWSALNFFNAVPDDRFGDPAYAGKFIKENYYPIAMPSKLGDLVFLLNKNGEVIHSAVFIADDLVFTKNGINYAQPWILTHMKNLLATYAALEEPKTVFYRRNTL